MQFSSHLSHWAIDMNVRVAVVPVAGWGTRLLPATKAIPKEMFPLGNKPVIQYVAEELAGCGIEHIIFVTSTSKKAIEDHLIPDPVLNEHLTRKNKHKLLAEFDVLNQIQCSFVFQHEQNGLGHAVACAQSIVNEPFVIALGDAVMGLGGKSQIVEKLCQHMDDNIAGVIAFHEVPGEHVNRYGIAAPRTEEDVFELDDLVEKPSVDQAPSNLAIAARYVFSQDLFDYLQKTTAGTGNEIQLTDAVKMMIRDGRKVLGVKLSGEDKRYDIGNFPSYLKAILDFATLDPECNQVLQQWKNQS